MIIYIIINIGFIGEDNANAIGGTWLQARHSEGIPKQLPFSPPAVQMLAPHTATDWPVFVYTGLNAQKL